MTIATRDQLIAALADNHDRIVIDKASMANAAAGQLFSLWTSAGAPGAGSDPGAAAVATRATTGAISFTNQTAPASSYLAWLAMTNTTNSASTIEFHDRLAHMGGLSGTVTTSQGALSLVTTAPSADRLGATDYSDVQWFLEVYTALGATVVTATAAVEYNDGSTGNLAAVSLGATPRAGRLYPLVSAVAGKWIRAVTGVTLSASTLTAGNFGITASRSRTVIPCPLLNLATVQDWAALGLPEVYNDACLWLVNFCSTTTTGAWRGSGKIVHG